MLSSAILASAIYVATKTDLLGSIATVRDLDPSMMAAACLATLAAVVNRGFLHHESRSLHGVEHDLGQEIRMSAASLALNKVVKSGGLAGLAFYIRCARRDGAAVGPVTRAFIVVGAAAHVALAGLAVTVLVVVPRDELPLAGAFSDMVVGGAGAIALAVVVGIFVTGVLTAPSRHGAFRVISGAVRLVLHAGANKLLGVCTLAAVLSAAGADVGFETVVLVYATALVSGALSIIPAGIGVVEASTVAVLTASGVDPSIAIVAMLAFRLFDLWIPVLVGWLLARRIDLDEHDLDATVPVSVELVADSIPSAPQPGLIT